MKNFNSKFKNKKLKRMVWKFAKSPNMSRFKRLESKIQEIDCRVIPWLKAIGYEKITFLFSPVCRFRTLTSNNIENLNARFEEARRGPVMELLLSIEEAVITDRHNDWTEGEKWDGYGTSYMDSKV